jgi:lipoprotein-anchoring transpeptidase ErfK/SrfK
MSQAEQSAITERLYASASIAENVGWHWWSATEVDGRPEQFWPLGEQAALNCDLNGLVLEGHPVIDSNQSSSFVVNESHEVEISAASDQMQVYDNSQLLNTFPVSLGKPGYPTISGTLVVLYKTPVIFMTSASNGWNPALYAENVYLDVAISADGYYIHSAPWDIPDHGRYNVSFGCIEETPVNAQWFYDWIEPGDVVVVSGTPLTASEADGQGDWNAPWSDFSVPTIPNQLEAPQIAPTPKRL